MNYLALARRWRPRNFKTMVGQEANLRALQNALDTGRLHHAYLFTGMRGVGKTTIARILAKCLNCEVGISSNPCGSCSTCQSIDEGRYVDLIEVDAASRTKVEDTRELLDNVQYLPTQGRFKIYLIDEVHMLSGHSFNALLKTLEEPPNHVKFLLATTDPQKLPVTVLSRCLQFHLRRIPFNIIVDHLENILRQEFKQDEKDDQDNQDNLDEQNKQNENDNQNKTETKFEKEALRIIAKNADGSLRDALSLLDQALAYGNGSLTAQAVREMLGLSEKHQLLNLLQMLIEGKGTKALQAINTLSETVPDFSSLLAEFLTVLHQLAILQHAPDALEDTVEERETLVRCAQDVSPEQVQLWYQIGIMGQRDLPFAPDPKTGFEMIILRMLSFHPAEVVRAEVAGTEIAREAISPEKIERSKIEGSRIETSKIETLKIDAPESPTRIEQTEKSVQYEKSERSERSEKPVQPEISKKPEKAQISPAQPRWQDIIAKLPLSGVTKILAEHCVIEEWNGDYIQLILDPIQKPLLNKRNEERLQEALTHFFKKPMGLKINVKELKMVKEAPYSSNHNNSNSSSNSNGNSSSNSNSSSNRVIESNRAIEPNNKVNELNNNTGAGTRVNNNNNKNNNIKEVDDPHVQNLMNTFNAKVEKISYEE